MSKRKHVETKAPVASVQQNKRELFAKEYQALCVKHGLQITASPFFRPRDDGTWSIVIQFSVMPFEAKQENGV